MTSQLPANGFGKPMNYTKKEAEYQATIAAMRKRIEDLEGKKKQSSQVLVEGKNKNEQRWTTIFEIRE